MRQNTGEWLMKTFDSEETSAADQLLAVAAVIVEEMRAAIFEQTGFRCSAGIAHNKVSAASQGFSGFFFFLSRTGLFQSVANPAGLGLKLGL